MPSVIAWATTRSIVAFIVFVSLVTIPLVPRGAPEAHASPDNLIVDGLVRWDSWSYVYVASRGYVAGNAQTGDIGTVGRFPLYPVLMYAVGQVTHDLFSAGIVVSNAALLVGLLYVHRLARCDFDVGTAGRSVFYLASAPGAVFLSAVYSESLFIALVAATLFYARTRRWVYAGLCGGLAAATRNTGVLLAGVIILEALVQQLETRRAGQAPGWGDVARALRDLRFAGAAAGAWVAAALVCVGLLVYMVYLGLVVGDPLGWVHSMDTYGRHVTPTAILTLPVEAWNALGLGPHVLAGQVDPANLIDTLATLAMVPVVIGVVRSMRPSYGFYALATFLAPGLSSATLFGMTRYSLMLVPCFILLGRWGARPWVDRVIVAISLPLMGYIAVTFSHNQVPI